MSATCKTCRFWNKLERGHTYADCRRQPPQFNLTVSIRRDRYGERQDDITVSRFPNAQWPNTSEDDWCGEHSARAEKAEARVAELEGQG